ncbi:malto-oligosyltrehalose trehalohydrolase [Gloeocapsa sp. PCC 73106]|uniref:malto-oligosyltrehalose trehalohydrolase n=1 Tax=Gloeocapsa sp. PCC 73106 TaxID=102232 RepID=UPI0002AC523B|nr:malto-oligosyltrehalose trehalohydrolase [Gloeocapsa sp. PCC 73106]ELR98549.1 malto-oligosyltrehalose trehalohydrolase [Gloeocapsa sp. PCC 73106]
MTLFFCQMRIGAHYLGNDTCEFRVWAPLVETVAVKIIAPQPRLLEMKQDERGYWEVIAAAIPPGTLYQYQLDGIKDRPDPASASQPDGVHGPSEVVYHQAFTWSDGNWQNIALEKLIIYELHVGTFSESGTFDGVIAHLGDLEDLGINCIEIMPVAQFPGTRNWGYDGVYHYGVQNSYGGPLGLKKLVDACHQRGIAVILDVVYNHFGPEGNYTQDFGPYLTEKYQTPWGSAINFDDAYSYGVRNFFRENALYWLREYHVDGLRLDAIHTIYDLGAKHILEEISESVEEYALNQGRPFHLIPESDLNDVRVLRPRNQGGYGLNAQWSDDFHHSLHTLLTGEKEGYYLDFGGCAQFAQVCQDSFAYTGNYSHHRRRYHGSSVSDRPFSQFVVYAQNHDQVGNRMRGERLSELVCFEALKLAAGAVILAPGIPMLFMGEEYGEKAPFLYFISHSDPELVKAVQQGRAREYAEFQHEEEPPNPASVETFESSRLDWSQRDQGEQKILLQFYQRLIELRKNLSPLTNYDRDSVKVYYEDTAQWLYLTRTKGAESVLILMNFSQSTVQLPQITAVNWKKRLDSASKAYLGPGSTLSDHLNPDSQIEIPPLTFAVYEAQR